MTVYIPINIDIKVQYNIVEYGLGRAMSPLTYRNDRWYMKYYVHNKSLWLVALLKYGFPHIAE